MQLPANFVGADFALHFLLDGIALTPVLFQPDNLHPTAEAQPRILENVWRGLEPLLK